MTDNDKRHPSEKDDDVLVTEPFVIHASDYFNRILLWWLFKYGWILLFPILTVAILGIILEDERIAISALLMIFIIAPMVMAFIFLYYMLVPEIRRVVLRKRVVIARDRYVRLEYLPDPRYDKVAESKDTDDDTSTEHIPPQLPDDETITWDAIVKVVVEPHFTVFLLHSKRRMLIVIPNSAIKNQ